MTRLNKKFLSVIMSISLISATVTGCGKANTETAGGGDVQSDAALELPTAETKDEAEAASLEVTSEAEENTQESETGDTSGHPMDSSVMTPWINSTIIGMVTEDVNADLKDDFYLNVNHDWLMNAKLRPGYPTELPLLDAADIVKDRCLDMLTDTSLTGEDAEKIQNYYELWLDWEGRNETGIDPILPYAQR